MRIAAVGDSVMWGQGLMPPLNPSHFEGQQKYFFKIVEWLQNEGKVQEFDMADFQAHSGAIIGTSGQKSSEAILSRDDAPNKEVYDLFYGEVPDAFPTVLRQLDKLKGGDTIDILIINGGPNDVGILKSVDFSDVFKEGLRLIDEVASVKLPVLFKEARKKCPNALIIYTGYYPALSERSSAIRALGDLNIFAPVLRFIPLDEFLGGLFLAFNHERLKKQGVSFHQRMLARFREQIAKFNLNRDPSSPPILFCPSGFGLSNAMFAPNQMIFTIEDDPGVTAMRKPFCEAIQGIAIENFFRELDLKYNITNSYERYLELHGIPIIDIGDRNEHFKIFNKSVTSLKKLLCENAFIAHPNKKGAEQYYKQLKKRIEIQLNFSLRNHFKAMDPQILSIRKLREKYSFAPCSSLRRMSDVLWLDVISIGFNVSNYAGPSRDFLSTLYFDFGWGYQMASNQNGLFIFDIMDRKRLSSLKYVRIRLPKFQGIISKLSLDFYIKINGYSLPFIALTEKSFRKSGDDWVWGMPTLNFKPENA
jgi:hypothetical protein